MNNNIGISVINELTELERRMTVEWGPVQQKVFDYVNSFLANSNIRDEKEIEVAMGASDFERMRDGVLQRNRELMRELEQFGHTEVPDHVIERKNEIFIAFDRASVKLAETSLIHRELTTLPRDFTLQISQTLLTRISNLQEVSSDILGTLRNPNNDHNLRAQTNTWREKINETWSALTDIHMLIPTHRLQRNQLEQLRALLTRVKQLNCPLWYIQFVEAVGANAIEEVQQFRVSMEEYNHRIEELITDMEQFLGY